MEELNIKTGFSLSIVPKEIRKIAKQSKGLHHARIGGTDIELLKNLTDEELFEISLEVGAGIVVDSYKYTKIPNKLSEVIMIVQVVAATSWLFMNHLLPSRISIKKYEKFFTIDEVLKTLQHKPDLKIDLDIYEIFP